MDFSNSTPLSQRSDPKAAGINTYIYVFSGRILSYAYARFETADPEELMRYWIQQCTVDGGHRVMP